MYINTKVIFEWNPELQKYVETYTEGYEYDGEMMMAGILDILGEVANTSAGDLIRGASTKIVENWPNQAELEKKREEKRKKGKKFDYTDVENQYLPADYEGGDVSDFHTNFGPYKEGDPQIREYNGKQYFVIKDANGNFTWHPGSKGMYYDQDKKKFVDKEGTPMPSRTGKGHVGAGGGPDIKAPVTGGVDPKSGGTNGFASEFKPEGRKPWLPTSPKPVIDTETGDLVGGEPEEYMGVTKRQWELLGGMGAGAAGGGIAALVGGGKKAGNSLIDWVEKRKQDKKNRYVKEEYGWTPEIGKKNRQAWEQKKADRDYVKKEYGWTPEIGEENRQVLQQKQADRELEEKAIQQKVDRELEEKAIQRQKEERQKINYNTYGTNDLDKIKQFNEAAGKHTGGDVDEFMKQYKAGIGIDRLDPSTGVSNSILDNKGQPSIGTSYKAENLQNNRPYSLKNDPGYLPLREKILKQNELDRGNALIEQYSHLLEPEDLGLFEEPEDEEIDTYLQNRHISEYDISGDTLGGALGVATDQSLHDNIFKTHAGFTEKTMQKNRDLRKALAGLDPTGKYKDVQANPDGNRDQKMKAWLMRKATRQMTGKKWYQKQDYKYDWQ